MTTAASPASTPRNHLRPVGPSAAGFGEIARRPAPGRLSGRELGLLAVVATGLPAPSIGRQLGVSERTVRRRMREVCTKLDVATPIEAVAWAARRNLI